MRKTRLSDVPDVPANVLQRDLARAALEKKRRPFSHSDARSRDLKINSTRRSAIEKKRIEEAEEEIEETLTDD